jgi:hypothetical protein
MAVVGPLAARVEVSTVVWVAAIGAAAATVLMIAVRDFRDISARPETSG